MSIRSSIASFVIKSARGIGRTLGCQLVVEASDHSLQATMELPSTDKRAWDPNLYKSGQLYVSGYANPIKPTVRKNIDLKNPDHIETTNGQTQTDGGTDTHTSLISSARYRAYMRQDLISQLLNPREQWTKLLIAVGIVALLILVNFIVTLQIAGVF